MTEFCIPSEELPVNTETQKLFNFLTDFKNFSAILPTEKTVGFNCSENSCTFNIKGITPITILLKSKIPTSEIFFVSENLGRFNFNLRVVFNTVNGKEYCRVIMGGNLNPFLFKMAKEPLTDLVISMNRKLSELNI